MRRLSLFNNVTLDGFFTDANGDMGWAHERAADDEWQAFSEQNASGGGALVFGRVTYEQMEAFWPTAQAREASPALAQRMTEMEKIVFSRTRDRASWGNTTFVNGDPAATLRTMKKEAGADLVILGSGTIASQLTAEGLIDEYKFVVNPVLLGHGRTLFDRVDKKLNLKLISTRSFRNGNLFVCYEPA